MLHNLQTRYLPLALFASLTLSSNLSMAGDQTSDKREPNPIHAPAADSQSKSEEVPMFGWRLSSDRSRMFTSALRVTSTITGSFGLPASGDFEANNPTGVEYPSGGGYQISLGVDFFDLVELYFLLWRRPSSSVFDTQALDASNNAVVRSIHSMEMGDLLRSGINVTVLRYAGWKTFAGLELSGYLGLSSGKISDVYYNSRWNNEPAKDPNSHQLWLQATQTEFSILAGVIYELYRNDTFGLELVGYLRNSFVTTEMGLPGVRYHTDEAAEDPSVRAKAEAHADEWQQMYPGDWSIYQASFHAGLRMTYAFGG